MLLYNSEKKKNELMKQDISDFIKQNIDKCKK